jgi:hypothetical protein
MDEVFEFHDELEIDLGNFESVAHVATDSNEQFFVEASKTASPL